MNINDLTIGQAKELARMLGGATGREEPCAFAGKYVIARCTAAGVHSGVLVRRYGLEVLLHDARRLWRWGPKGPQKFLDGVALTGIAVERSKIGAQVAERLVLDCCEITPCTAEAEASIRDAPVEERES